MLCSRDSRVLQYKDKNKFEINKVILLLLFIPYPKLTSLALSLTVKNIMNIDNEIRRISVYIITSTNRQILSCCKR